jgi:hypothetical protein
MLFNAAIAGLNGSQERWLRSHEQGDYAKDAGIIAEIATSIDAAIPIFVGGSLTESARVLQSITHAVFSQRTLVPNVDYTSIASSIAALFLEMQSLLQPVPGGGDGPDDDNVLSMNFTGSTGTSVLQSLVAGGILVFSQITITAPFDAGSRVQLGTSALSNRFLDLPEPTPGSYGNALIVVPENDFLILTVTSPSSNGSGIVFYESQ